jgi:hypothetical protein
MNKPKNKPKLIIGIIMLTLSCILIPIYSFLKYANNSYSTNDIIITAILFLIAILISINFILKACLKKY